MKKFIKWICFIGAAILLVSIGSNTVNLPVNTATVYAKKAAKKSKWHKGMPKALWGKYEWRKYNSYGDYMWENIEITPSKYVIGIQGMTETRAYNIKYKNNGHNCYIIKYDTHNMGMVIAQKNHKDYIKKSKNTIWYTTKQGKKTKWSEKYKKVKKF